MRAGGPVVASRHLFMSLPGVLSMPSIASDLAAAASLLSPPRPQPATLSQDNDPDGDTPFAALLDVNSPATAAATNPSAPGHPPHPPQPLQASPPPQAASE